MTENHSSCIKVSDTGIFKNCYSTNIIKNGRTKTKKQQYFCKNCKIRFLDYYSYNAYHKNTNQQIITFTKEGMGIRSISRILKISVTTLLKRIVAISNAIIPPKIKYQQSFEIDELRFFIKKRTNLAWLVYSIDKRTKQVVGFNIGKRTNQTLNVVVQTILNSNPVKVYTDKLRNYKFLIPKEVHCVKRFGTNYIERKNLSIRTHLKRLNRRTICFTRSLSILIAVLKIYFWSL